MLQIWWLAEFEIGEGRGMAIEAIDVGQRLQQSSGRLLRPLPCEDRLGDRRAGGIPGRVRLGAPPPGTGRERHDPVSLRCENGAVAFQGAVAPPCPRGSTGCSCGRANSDWAKRGLQLWQVAAPQVGRSGWRGST